MGKMVASLDESGIAPAYIVGHSLGGATATAYSQFLAAGPLEFGEDTFLVTFGASHHVEGWPEDEPRANLFQNVCQEWRCSAAVQRLEDCVRVEFDRHGFCPFLPQVRPCSLEPVLRERVGPPD